MVKQIDVLTAKQQLSNNEAILVDIRDDVSFALGHPENAIHLTGDNLDDFISSTDRFQPILVMCYHGISSINVGQYLLQNGFVDVSSISGGYEEWKRNL